MKNKHLSKLAALLLTAFMLIALACALADGLSRTGDLLRLADAGDLVFDVFQRRHGLSLTPSSPV